MKSLCDSCTRINCDRRSGFNQYTVLCSLYTDIIPAVPSPKDDNPNIQELCFHNGEQHMKEKVLNLIKEIERKFGAAAKMTTVLLRGEIEKL